jgi:hypothetical protein
MGIEGRVVRTGEPAFDPSLERRGESIRKREMEVVEQPGTGMPDDLSMVGSDDVA